MQKNRFDILGYLSDKNALFLFIQSLKNYFLKFMKHENDRKQPDYKE